MSKQIALHLKDNLFDANGTVVCPADFVIPQDKQNYRRISLDTEGSRGNAYNDAWSYLSPYNNWTLRELSESLNGGILTGIGGVSDDSQKLFSIHPFKKDEKSQVTAFRIDTRNLMGWVSFPDGKGNSVRLNITSRFDRDVIKQKKEEKKGASAKKSIDCDDDYSKQYFLYYMLARACRVNALTELDVDRKGNGEKLVSVLLFINLLGKAEPYGIMRSYVKLRKNDMNVKGRIDISRHIKLNYPVGGRIAYVQRKLTADIPVNHLIRHAAELICKRYKNLLAGNKRAKAFLDQLRLATPSWRSDAVQSDAARQEANRVVTHPFHAEQYEPLRQMALKVLRNAGVDLYGNNSRESASGIVFDGSWLWENYLWDVLRRSGIEGLVHSDNGNKSDPNRIHPLTDGPVTWYPDFRVDDDNGGCRAVLDAKYKPLEERLENGKYLSDDIHEVLSYMYALGARRGFLLHPCKKDKQWEPFKLSGFGGDFHFVGMEIPQSAEFDKFATFCEEMQKAENEFIRKLKELLPQSETP